MNPLFGIRVWQRSESGGCWNAVVMDMLYRPVDVAVLAGRKLLRCDHDDELGSRVEALEVQCNEF